MTLKQAFSIFKKENDTFKYCPYGNGIDSFFLDNKENFIRFQDNDFADLNSYLMHNEHRWFVFYLLNVIPSFPDELFEPLLNAILSFGGDSWRHGSTYDNVARLYGFDKVEIFLQNKFINSYSDIYKRSIVEAMWRNSYSKPYIIPDDDLDFITEYRYIWKDNWYQFIEFIPESQEEAKLMLLKQDALIQKRYKILLEHFLYKNLSHEFFHDCSVLLPRKRETCKNENMELFDKLIEKLRKIKQQKSSIFAIYLSNPVNNWHWI